MKRSEMVELIDNILLDAEIDGHRANADTLLRLIEEAGMLPPMKHYDSDQYLTHDEFHDIMRDSGFDDYDSKWGDEE